MSFAFPLLLLLENFPFFIINKTDVVLYTLVLRIDCHTVHKLAPPENSAILITLFELQFVIETKVGESEFHTVRVEFVHKFFAILATRKFCHEKVLAEQPGVILQHFIGLGSKRLYNFPVGVLASYLLLQLLFFILF